jgi:hypothetical protein
VKFSTDLSVWSPAQSTPGMTVTRESSPAGIARVRIRFSAAAPSGACFRLER